ncbi:TetR family transcriptional regulator [Streptomyces capparidis]
MTPVRTASGGTTAGPPSPCAAPGAAPAGPGLRERKKARTRLAIRREAYRLFALHGWDATTVERICAAAEVSTSTFFRYFPAKEDIVLTDEYGGRVAAALRARPADEPVPESLRQVARQVLGDYLADSREELRVRIRLFREVPALRARTAGTLEPWREAVQETVAARTGHAPGSLPVRVVSGALVAALAEAFSGWPEDAGPERLFADVDAALDLLGRGLAAEP